jgi:hypothetical protein
VNDHQKFVEEFADEVRTIQGAWPNEPDMQLFVPGLVLATAYLILLDENETPIEEAKQSLREIFAEPGIDRTHLEATVNGLERFAQLVNASDATTSAA